MPFDKAIALHCAKRIQAVYPGGGTAPNIVAKKTDTQALVETMPDGRMLIVFPGTASFHDALTDVKIRKTVWHEAACVHTGFNEAWEDIGLAIHCAANKGTPIVVGGHSLGGSLTTLAADSLRRAGYPVEAVITFGSPRTGNGQFAQAYDQYLGDVTVRIVNADDPVPWMPLPLPTLTSGIYTHVDREHYLNRYGGVDVATSALGHVREIISLIRLKEIERILLAPAHHIGSYIAKLEALA